MRCSLLAQRVIYTSYVKCEISLRGIKNSWSGGEREGERRKKEQDGREERRPKERNFWSILHETNVTNIYKVIVYKSRLKS